MTDKGTNPPERPDRRRYVALAVMLALAVFMYASIAYKIVNFGP